jgi:Flp pilus assembly protein TadD
MRRSIVSLVAALLSLGLAHCTTTGANSPAASNEVTAADAFASATPADPAAPGGLLGDNPNDDLSLAKKYYRDGDFGLAEKHFRHAVELHPRSGEAWLGLAASLDRLRRFDLADRAYAQAIRVLGPTAEVLNNQGYSYMLRGDLKKAGQKLHEADVKSPNNPYVQNNLQLLGEIIRSKRSL